MDSQIMSVCVLLVLYAVPGIASLYIPAINVTLSSKNQTWSEAVNDTSCSLVGLNHTGDLKEEENKYFLNYSSVTESFRAWVGAHVEYVWVNFEGCRFGRILQPNGITIINKDPVKSCLKHCNSGRFILTNDTCLCDSNVYIVNSGCLAKPCSYSGKRFCGDAKSSNQSPSYHCMCKYSVYETSKDLNGGGKCLTITYNGNQSPIYNATNCSSSFRPLCYNPSVAVSSFGNKRLSWSLSFLECYNINKQFAGIRNLTLNSNYGTYWIGVFAVTFIKWGILNAMDREFGCVALVKQSNTDTKEVVIPCETRLPSLCVKYEKAPLQTTETTQTVAFSFTTEKQFRTTGMNKLNEYTNTIINIEVKTTIPPGSETSQHTSRTMTISDVLGTESRTRFPGETSKHITVIQHQMETKYVYPSTSTTQTKNNKDTEVYTENEHISVIIGPIVGVVSLFVLILIVMCYRRRALRRKQTSRDKEQGPQLSNENEMGYVNYDGNKGETNTTDIYDKLHEDRNNMETFDGDMYDHTCANESGETYGHLNTGRRQFSETTENNYDHTFVGETIETYGHLNKHKMGNFENAYDHTYIPRVGASYDNQNSCDIDTEYDHINREPYYGTIYPETSKSGMGNTSNRHNNVNNMYAQVIAKGKRNK